MKYFRSYYAAHRRMRNVTNYFLVNLALADLGMVTLNCIPSFIFMRDRSALLSSGNTPHIPLCSRQWIFGSVYCSINSFTSYLTVSVSVFTLLALTVERYKVGNTVKHIKTKQVITVVEIWGL